MCPSHISMSLSKHLNAAELGEWIVDIIVLPFLAYFWSNFTIFKAVKLSRPEVGSSKKIIEGSVINSTPIAVLFLSPPERVLILIDPTIVLAA